MRTLRKLFVFGGLILLVLTVVVWQTPASWIAKSMNLSQQGIGYARMSGTLWKGRVDQVLYRDLMMGDISWDFQTFNQLNPLRTTWRVEGEGIDYELGMLVDAQGREARDLRLVQGHIPAGWADLSKVAPMVFLSGRFNLDLDHASPVWNLSNLATGTIYWNDAGLSGAVDESLGNVLIELYSENRFTVLDVQSDPESDLKLDGQIRFNFNQYSAELVLSAPEEKWYVLELLADLGTVTDEGTLEINKSGRMSR